MKSNVPLPIYHCKRLIRSKRWRTMYNRQYSRLLNEMTFHWIEYYICRHFLNGACSHDETSCPRIHMVVSPSFLMYELAQVQCYKNLACSNFLQCLVSQATREHWKCEGYLRRILHHTVKQLI